MLPDAIDEYIYKKKPYHHTGYGIPFTCCILLHYASHVTCLSCLAFLRKASDELAQFPRLQCSQRRHHSCHKESQDVARCRGVAMRDRLDSILWDSETGSAPYSRSTVSLPSKSVPVDRGSGYRVWGQGWCTRNPYVSIHFLLCILPVAVHYHYPGTRIRLGNQTGRLKEWMMSMTIPMVSAKSKKTQGGDCSARISATEKVFCARVAMPANYCQLYFGRVLWRFFASWLEVKRRFLVFFTKISMICVWPFQQLRGLVAKLA